MVVTDGYASGEQLLGGACSLCSLHAVDVDGHGGSAADSHDVVPVAVVHRSRGGQVHLVAAVVDEVGHRTIGVHVEHVLTLVADATRIALLDHDSCGVEAGCRLHMGGDSVVTGSQDGCSSSRIETVVHTVEGSFAAVEGDVIDAGVEAAAGVVQSCGRTNCLVKVPPAVESGVGGIRGALGISQVGAYGHFQHIGEAIAVGVAAVRITSDRHFLGVGESVTITVAGSVGRRNRAEVGDFPFVGQAVTVGVVVGNVVDGDTYAGCIGETSTVSYFDGERVAASRFVVEASRSGDYTSSAIDRKRTVVAGSDRISHGVTCIRVSGSHRSHGGTDSCIFVDVAAGAVCHRSLIHIGHVHGNGRCVCDGAITHFHGQHVLSSGLVVEGCGRGDFTGGGVDRELSAAIASCDAVGKSITGIRISRTDRTD
ncbi:hypothetical protein Rhal01_03784 [Rubritalea halochordaticola]|uniref:Uncharacterized protein n=1 Tax=Rubritalea halochordaticola TaxID=714537 RepID=A0ABP9V4I6_9BACT